MVRACNLDWKIINAYRILVVKSFGKSIFGRPRRRYEYDVKMDFRKHSYEGEMLFELILSDDGLWYCHCSNFGFNSQRSAPDHRFRVSLRNE